MNSPVITPIEPILGTDHPIRIRIRDGHGRPRDLTGAVARVHVKATRVTEDVDALLVYDSSIDATWFTNHPFGDDGIIDFKFPAADFDDFEDSVAAWWNCKVTIPAVPADEQRCPGAGPFRPQAM